MDFNYNDLPEITILTPVYGRHKFLPLLIRNIKHQNYPQDKIKVIIDECRSDELFIQDIVEFKKLVYPVQVTHMIHDERKSIGEKRNRLVASCTTDIFQFFDTDDLYNIDCLLFNYSKLKETNAKCVGSNKMLFCYTKDNYRITGIDCGDDLKLIHEATIMASKKWFMKTCKFSKKNSSEGQDLFAGVQKSQICNVDVNMVMLCLVHSDNTINKDHFNNTTEKSQILNKETQSYLERIFKN